jgi:branched-chain amino acid transport system permease protein
VGLALALVVPGAFAFGVGLHWIFKRFAVGEFGSLLVTFSIAVLIETLIQWLWTADFRRYETPLASASIPVGPLFVPVLEPSPSSRRPSWRADLAVADPQLRRKALRACAETH